MIRREISGIENTVTLMVEVDLENADPVSLDIGGFWDRHPEGIYWKTGRGKTHVTSGHEAAAVIFALTFKAQLVGAVPNFDARGIENLFEQHGFPVTWYHRLVCVESMTAGFFHKDTGGLKNCAEMLAIEWDPAYPEHTALGDAVVTKKIYDAIMEEPLQ